MRVVQNRSEKILLARGDCLQRKALNSLGVSPKREKQLLCSGPGFPGAAQQYLHISGPVGQSLS